MSTIRAVIREFGDALGARYLRRIARSLEDIVGRLEPITTAATRISEGLDGVADEIRKVADQLATGNITDEQIAAAAETLNAQADRLADTRTAVDQLVEVEGEDDATDPVPDGGGSSEGEEPTPTP